MINNVVLVGRITRDLEIRKTPNGASVLNFNIAVNRRGTQQPGQPDADFINCVAWNRTADLMGQYLHKGSLIGVQGRIQTRSYDNQQGQRVYVTEVVADSVQFLESRNAQSGQQMEAPSYQQPSMPVQDTSFDDTFSAEDTVNIASDDLPF
jgi:single-strand DNA-binding protein